MGKELLLSSTEVVPKKLLSNGFEFLHRSITSCLQNQIK
jgi:NAD dependent epimerase/dehydratase family enzyme